MLLYNNNEPDPYAGALVLTEPPEFIFKVPLMVVTPLPKFIPPVRTTVMFAPILNVPLAFALAVLVLVIAIVAAELEVIDFAVPPAVPSTRILPPALFKVSVLPFKSSVPAFKNCNTLPEVVFKVTFVLVAN